MILEEYNDFNAGEFRNNVILIETSTNFEDEPYMRVYSGDIPFDLTSESVKMCRLSLIRPYAFNYEDEDLVLTKCIIDNIFKGLKSVPKFPSCDGVLYNTVWESLISDTNYIRHDVANNELNKKVNIKDIPTDIPIPDYYQLLK